MAWYLLLIEWNSIRLGSHAHGIVTKTIHKTLPGGCGGQGGGVGRGGREKLTLILAWYLLSIKWNLIRLGGHAHGIVTKTVHKTLPWGGMAKGVGGWRRGGGAKGWK